MKKKSTTYLLISVLVIVWGGIGYKIYTGLFDDGGPLPMATLQSKHEVSVSGKDTFSLIADYLDPFLRNSNTSFAERNQTLQPANSDKEHRQKKVEVQPPVIQKQEVKPQAPSISLEYKGMITNVSAKKKLALLRVNGADITLMEGEQAGRVKIRNFNSDSIYYYLDGRKEVNSAGIR